MARALSAVGFAPALLAALALAPATVRAQVAATASPSLSIVALHAPPCIEQPYDRGHLLELLQVELTAVGVSGVTLPTPSPEGASATPPLADVELTPNTCASDTREVTIRVVDHVTRKTVERRMTITDVTVMERPRALAIGIAELLQASWAETEIATVAPPPLLPPAVEAALAARMRPTPALAADTTARIDAALAAGDRRDRAHTEAQENARRRPEFDLRGMARAFTSRATDLLGIAATLRFRPAPNMTLHVGADAGLGGARTRDGSVAIRAAAADVGVALATNGETELQVGPRVLVGYGSATGSANSPDFQGRTYGNPFVVALLGATVLFHVDAGWTGIVGVEGGYTLTGVSFLTRTAGETERVAGIDGTVVGVSAGVGFGL